MPEREDALKRKLSIFGRIDSVIVPKIKEKDLSTTQYQEVTKIYKALGGVLAQTPINYGPYDIIFDDCVVELDEENHFNRYRKQTLNANIYGQHLGFNAKKYKSYCDNYEDECQIRGKYWTSESTEKQFGQPAPNGILASNGSPRWKQRAYYDFIKDNLPYCLNIPLIRLSIYDEIEKGVTINDILTKNKDKYIPLIVEIIKKSK